MSKRSGPAADPTRKAKRPPPPTRGPIRDAPQLPPAREVALATFGARGLREYSGYVREELHTKLQGTTAIKVYREMADNDALVSAVLYLVDVIAGQVDWFAAPAHEGDSAVRAGDFVDTVFADMEQTWPEVLSEAVLTLAEQGWAWFELVFKRRCGSETRDPTQRSRHADYWWGLRKIDPRHPDTLQRWDFDEEDNVRGMFQTLPGGRRTRYVPRAKSMHIVLRSRKGDPQGRSLLRGMYRPWHFKKRLEELEGLIIERDGAGTPKVTVPAAWLAESASADEKAQVATLRAVGEGLRADRYQCIVTPAEEDAGGKTGITVGLMSSPGGRAVPTDPVIQRWSKQLLQAALSEIIELGMGNVGSWALEKGKSNHIVMAVDAVLAKVAAAINRDVIPLLMRLNGVPEADWPVWTYGEIKAKNLPEFAAYITAGLSSGALTPSDDLEESYREYGDLKPLARSAERSKAEVRHAPTGQSAIAAAAATRGRPRAAPTRECARRSTHAA